MRRRIVISCVLGLLVTTGAAWAQKPSTRPTTATAPAEPRKDAELFQGVWNQTNGDQGLQFEFAGDTLIQRLGPRRIETARAQFKLNPAANPKRIDWGDGAGVGIYKLEGAVLTICHTSGAPGDRPDRFEDDGGKYQLLVFHRGKAR